MSEPICCGECPHLQQRERRDYFPAGVDYQCGKLKEWIGFVDVKLDCGWPVPTQLTLEFE